jgi:hypothetical protein
MFIRAVLRQFHDGPGIRHLLALFLFHLRNCLISFRDQFVLAFLIPFFPVLFKLLKRVTALRLLRLFELGNSFIEFRFLTLERLDMRAPLGFLAFRPFVP